MNQCNFLDFFRDAEQNLSFKRLQTAVFLLLFVLAFLSDLILHKTVSEPMLDTLALLVAYGYTGIVIERFNKKQPIQQAQEATTNNT